MGFMTFLGINISHILIHHWQAESKILTASILYTNIYTSDNRLHSTHPIFHMPLFQDGRQILETCISYFENVKSIKNNIKVCSRY